MIFGGISGSSVADTASEGSIIIPQMVRKGYTPQFASGITVASSTMGMIIPPSVPMVIYSCVSGESVGKLFLGGLIPGVLIGCFMLGVTLFICLRGDYPREDLKLTWKQKTNMSLRAWPALIMPIFVVGSVVTGMATATESAALGVFYALVVGFFVMKELRLRDIPGLLRDAIMISATVMIIIAFSQLYVWILALERVPQALASLVTGLDLPVLVFSIVFALIVLVIGTFVDVSPAILLLTPVFLPAMKSIGISGIQFGVLLICGLAIGLITPPVGMCLNVCSAISGLQIGVIFRAALPFLLANLVTLALVALIPALSTWLPALLMD
jgi:tripartite ATP-independent transporter DctM subunit